MIKRTLPKCLNQTRLWSHYFITDLKCFRSEQKKSCASIMRKCTVTSSLTKTWLPWTSLSSNSLNLKKRRSENNLANFKVAYTNQATVFVKKERTRGDEGTTHITTTSCSHKFSTAYIPPNTEQQLRPSFPRVRLSTHLHRRLLSQRQKPQSKGRISLCPQLIARKVSLDLFCHLDLIVNVC